MSTFSARRVAAIAPDAATSPPPRHGHDAGAAAEDIVERALAILGEESQDWVEDHRGKYLISREADLHRSSASSAAPFAAER
jgi:hypothetical protein